ncbi:MAG TPA: hypothetical protein PK079_11925 [Leptospiraceae bacterium]|nr:hypothetical protein [Leptospiraceae bacterium]HMW07110.1 hypothetical protein [Leptospiraceae bacterium]HMX31784.1 hypothetical protein [Leptospiraceae bacterium]HMY32573.1 hypothetical protein [Leptospiraceae bacterium]HMZ63893.1 hypothetical protein [Leptospiraceae bacterium]
MEYLNKYQLMLKLKDFIEIHEKTKISDLNEGVLKMYILHSKNQNNTPKEKLINYKLLRIDERLLNNSPEEISERDSIIVEFLIEELMKYYARSKKK